MSDIHLHLFSIQNTLHSPPKSHALSGFEAEALKHVVKILPVSDASAQWSVNRG